MLDRGRTLAEGNAQAVRSNPAVIAAYLGRTRKRGRPCSRSTTSPAATGASKSCTAFRSLCTLARSSRWSARTAPARPRCCARFPACSRFPAATVRFDDQAIDRLLAHQRVRRGIAQVPEGRQVFAPFSVDDNLRLGAFTRNDKAIEADLAANLTRRFRRWPKNAPPSPAHYPADSNRCSRSGAL